MTPLKLIQALIIDDEPDARQNVISHLTPFKDQINIVAEASNADEAQALITIHQPDLLFLDIAMPRKSGFDLLESIPNFKGEVIFITSFNQYAEDAFRYLAIGYLIKPLDVNEFNKTVSKTLHLIKLKKEASSYAHLLHLLENKKTNSSKIVVPIEDGYEVLNPDEVFYFESQRNYTNIICQGRTILVSRNLSKIEQWLSPDTFMRVHRSIIVNLSKITKVDKNGFVVLESNEKVKMSKQNKDEIAHRLSTL